MSHQCICCNSSSPSSSYDGNKSSALYLNGKSTQLSVKNPLTAAIGCDPDELSAEMWIYPLTEGKPCYLFCSESLRLVYFEQSLTLTLTDGINAPGVNLVEKVYIQLASNSWQHICVTLSLKSEELKIYVNGKHAKRNTDHSVQENLNIQLDSKKKHKNRHKTKALRFSKTDKEWCFGFQNVHNDNWSFHGYFKHIRVWTVALTAEDVMKQYKKGLRNDKGNIGAFSSAKNMRNEDNVLLYIPCNDVSQQETLTVKTNKRLQFRNALEVFATDAQVLEMSVGDNQQNALLFSKNRSVISKLIKESPHPIETPRLVEWEHRKVYYDVIEFNKIASTRLLLPCNYGKPMEFYLSFRTEWDGTGYCPGCVVQVYLGMTDRFSVGLLQYFSIGTSMIKSFNLTPPPEPGIYYITQRISLDYNFIPGMHSSNLNDAVAELIVLPRSSELLRIFSLLPSEAKSTMVSVKIMAKRKDCVWNRLPVELVDGILQEYIYSLLPLYCL